MATKFNSFTFYSTGSPDEKTVSSSTEMPESVFDKILESAKKTSVLKNIGRCYSAEGGFYLPFTSEVPRSTRTMQPDRQLRFCNGNQLRVKDWEGWTKKEIDTLADCFERAGVSVRIEWS